ncbi:uncharacterized protein LOC111479075 isoform X2 [Cucurbita maxima]|uniref:Uncharacterized protein LOC111479075 isoform X2 n=1 Tax=Cucurbita maxima TaxID=3661 RepID=A0A6J1IVU5_CUCMA|nr:uncharacterized protein LOC111479075 isoform X2 [Cucurbita maxima]
MAARFGRSLYRFSSVNRPTAPAPRYPSTEPRPSSPTTEPRPASPPSSRLIASPPNPVHKYPKSPEPKQKAMVHKGRTQKAQQPNAINIAGENVGAVMEIVESSKGEGGHVMKKKETPRGVVSNADDTVNDQDKDASKHHKAGAQKAPASSSLPTTTFLNNNFQSVNNSLLFDASLAHRDPGLHLAFSRNRTGDRFTLDDKKQHHAIH